MISPEVYAVVMFMAVAATLMPPLLLEMASEFGDRAKQAENGLIYWLFPASRPTYRAHQNFRLA